MSHPIYVTSAKRLANGSFQGQWAQQSATQLGSYVLREISQQMTPQSVYMGCVLQSGLGQAPARQATLQAGLPHNIPTTTINKICGSGMKSIQLAMHSIQAGEHNIVAAGGMESMSNAPYLLTKARIGYRMGHHSMIDAMHLDGLEDAYHKNDDGSRTAMGVFADRTAARYQISRHEQEQYVEETYHNAQRFLNRKESPCEIITHNHFDSSFEWPATDEPLKKIKLERFSVLKPVFSPQGTVTAATASGISDGAAAVCLANESIITKHNMQPLAKVIGFSEVAIEPEWFTLAPIEAIQNLCQKIGWQLSDVDLFEINEAFAIVPIAAMKELHIPREKINIHGGACVLGHPIGASGARIVVTLVHALKQYKLRKGIAVACIGGGEAIAIALENTAI